MNGWIWLEFAPISVPTTLVNIILHGSRPKYLVIHTNLYPVKTELQTSTNNLYYINLYKLHKYNYI